MPQRENRKRPREKEERCLLKSKAGQGQGVGWPEANWAKWWWEMCTGEIKGVGTWSD